MLKRFAPVLVLTLAGGLATVAPAEEIGPDTVVARVGTTEITLGHMIVLRSQLPEEYRQLPDDVLYQAVLDQLIRQSAVVEAAGGELSLGAKLALENERRSFVAGEALSRVAEEAVTDEAVQKAYDATYSDAEPTREYHAAHILVASEDEAKAIKAELDDGADFAELAKEKSTGPSGPNGGDLGWFSEGMMVKPFEDAVVALEPGAVSDPVQTQFGWHVIKLYDVRMKDAPPLNDVRDELVQQIQRDAMETALEKYTAEADVTRVDVEVDPAILKNNDLVGE
jgi:peptidyl-prolyl cis-trans isomerase C